MRCFMHPAVEAMAVCKRCGKAMCADCSSYSGHSGICPACRREEFITEKANLENSRTQAFANKKKCIVHIVLWSILAAILAAFSIGLAASVTSGAYFILVFEVLPLILIILNAKKYKSLVVLIGQMTERINYLVGEINKITLAMTKGSAEI